jgi:ABC-type multidrug transport system ATPase subunit
LVRRIQEKGKPSKEPPKNLVEETLKKNIVILKNINFKAEPAQLTVIIGQVASGKSTLIHALLGELVQTKGQTQYNGSIAYVSQQVIIK